MLNYANRKAHQPVLDWTNKQSHRCSAMVAGETECPASDCGWDELHQGAIKTDCLTCNGIGRVITFKRHEFLAIPVWGADKFLYAAPTPGVELGDCTLGITEGWEWLIRSVMDSKRSYLVVDDKTLRPVVMTPNIVPQIGGGTLVTCKLYTNTNGD